MVWLLGRVSGAFGVSQQVGSIICIRVMKVYSKCVLHWGHMATIYRHIEMLGMSLKLLEVR